MKTNLTREWTEYNHDYEKKVQDIRLNTGEELFECWPNAGEWSCMTNGKHDIPDADVTHTKLSLSNFE